MRFIYITSATDKVKMLDIGYKLIKEDERNHLYIFGTKDEETFSDSDMLFNIGINHIVSDILTF